MRSLPHRSTLPVSCLLALMLSLAATCTALAQGLSTRESSLAPIRGVVRALDQAAISIDFPARIAKLHVREAEGFERGDRLVTFDCRRVQAEHAAAIAHAREMRLTFESQAYLDTRGAVGKLDLAVARTRVDKAEAEAASIAARIDQCVLVAPFAGRVAELRVNEHEVPTSGQPFISLIGETRFEIDLIFPSEALRILEVGEDFRFRIDETGRTHPARVLRLGAAVDPVSQSVKVIAEFSETDGRIQPGMSGTAIMNRAELGQ